QRDFYRMFAYFNNVPEMGRAMKYGNSPPVIAAPLTEQRQSAEALQRMIEAADATLAKYSPRASVSIAGRWAATSGQVAAFPSAEFDGSRFVDGGTAANFEITEPWSIAADIRPDTDDGSIVSRMVENEKGKGYGVHLDRGKVHVHLTSAYADDAIRVETEQKVIEPGRVHHVTVTYDGTVSAAGVRVYVDGEPAALKVLLDSLYRPFGNAGRKFSQPLRVGAGWGPERRFRGHMESLRIYDRVLPPTEIRAMALRQDLSSIAAKPSQTRRAVENFAFRSQWLNHEAPQTAKEAWATKLALERKLEKLQRTFPTVMVMRENPKPRPAHLLIRGAYDKPGETVDRGTPDILGPLPPGSPNDRLGLALWVANAENPLTARVAVNRIWQMMFGAGIVRTTEDFGLQGDWPSHPDLLDWLATEFVRSGWDMKGLVRLIVTSATYRQSSALTPGLLARDPDNRLLARGPRHRLSPEMIRDSALTAAGLLNTTVGGPSVKPYQPAGLWQEQAMQDMEYVRSTGPDLYRRSLYTFWKRTIPPPMMMNFDAAARETCVVRETRTNTPLQGLNLMNDVTFVEAARVIGQRMLLEGGSSPEDRLRYGFRLVLSREPKTEELAVLARSLAWHRDYFASDSARSREYLAQGEAKPDASVTPGELAAYGSVASLILNLDEAVTKQ
ncbi:MAG TPA: DUF1553 domain-containing protein, partial [Bryobacteraceae bacterium]|nr:DUF1553 domain-containing protein [Bryobacteraceae bacterium]